MRLYPEACNQFIAESGRIRTASSRKTVIQHLRYLQSCHPGLTLDRFTYEMLAAYCLRKQENGKPSSPGAIASRRAQMRSFFSWAHFTGLIKHDPSAKLQLGVRVPHTYVRTHTWLTEAQFASVLNEQDTSPLGRRDRLVLLLAALTGLRNFELSQLRWSAFSSGLDRLTLIGKGGKLATLGVPPQLVSELRAWRAISPDPDVLIPSARIKNGWEDDGGELVILWDTPLGCEGLRNLVKHAGARAGVKELRPHDLRRSFAGWLEGKGVPLKDISMAMRHSNIATTDRYLERNPARACEVTAGFTIDLGVPA